MLFQGVVIAGLFQYSSSSPTDHKNIVFPMLISACGFVMGLFQVQMAAGAKFWQERWEEETAEVEKIIQSEKESRLTGNIFRPLFNTPSTYAYSLVLNRNKPNRKFTESFLWFHLKSTLYFLRDTLYTIIKPTYLFRTIGKPIRLVVNNLTREQILSRNSVSKIPIYCGAVFSLFWLFCFFSFFSLYQEGISFILNITQIELSHPYEVEKNP